MHMKVKEGAEWDSKGLFLEVELLLQSKIQKKKKCFVENQKAKVNRLRRRLEIPA